MGKLPKKPLFALLSIFYHLDPSLHFQVEASIKDGDIQGFQLFSKAEKHLSSIARKKDHSHGQEENSEEVLKSEPLVVKYGG